MWLQRNKKQNGRWVAVTTDDTRSYETRVTTQACPIHTGNKQVMGADSQVSNLERQNELLQQQLELQKQLSQQQQQQQQQYGGGFTCPPPPMFDPGLAYPPVEPPSSYDKIQ